MEGAKDAQEWHHTNMSLFKAVANPQVTSFEEPKLLDPSPPSPCPSPSNETVMMEDLIQNPKVDASAIPNSSSEKPPETVGPATCAEEDAMISHDIQPPPPSQGGNVAENLKQSSYSEFNNKEDPSRQQDTVQKPLQTSREYVSRFDHLSIPPPESSTEEYKGGSERIPLPTLQEPHEEQYAPRSLSAGLSAIHHSHPPPSHEICICCTRYMSHVYRLQCACYSV